MQLEVEFLDRLSEPVRLGKARSVSDIIRTALARYDFSNIVVMRPALLAISVRLPARIRQMLKKTARAKHTSVGQLVRAAVEAYLPRLESEAAGQLEMPMTDGAPPPREPAAKPRRRRKPRTLPRAKARTVRKKRAGAMTRKRKR
jgi:Arc/MetJ-type ribon-helix-helix transcriptional regulator